ncbi:preprotein translocase subunit SecG [Spiroplasma sp. TIUS-1]|uniref:preprotein translocase subunit SecG n=1 Tax=Spiroplasma sp. TIUS-1 TaxID=216963 RepID=UPI0013995CCE|nr:preprotein translocase subunit SecG [Spiroplasma sp. TIUS-1]QHX35623.1 preprotein translocase subunit SecG [Spiroplasma sp. TIUS-1]
MNLFAYSNSFKETTNAVIFGLEIFCMIVAIVMIIVGLVQNKKSQTGLSALNGGNDELFANSKERGLDKTLSQVMLGLGIILALVAVVMAILTNVIL